MVAEFSVSLRPRADPAGAAYLADVTRPFRRDDRTASRTAGSLTISVTPTVAAKLLIARLAELNAALPHVELRTVATEALSDFDRDQVDIAVRLTRQSFSGYAGGNAAVRSGIASASGSFLTSHSSDGSI
ncbi:DNA-binding transcriptional LysR family regulator [Sinorhizobium fredii]